MSPPRVRPEPGRPLPVAGPAAYVQAIGVAPGEPVRFHVSSPAAYTLDVVRLGRTAISDPDSDRVADRAEAELVASFSQEVATPRVIEPGSYIYVEGEPLPAGPTTLGLWVRPWRLPMLDQTQWAWASLLTDLDFPMAARFAVLFDHLGRIGVHVGDGGAFDHGDLRYSGPMATQRLGTWFHIAVTIGPGGPALFVDGRHETLHGGRGSGMDGLSAPTPDSRLRIGASAENGHADDYLDGDIATPFIAASALRQEQIEQIVSDRGRSRLPELGLGPLHGAWDLTEERGQTTADGSGNGRDGLIVQGATWQIGGPAFDASKGGPADDPLTDPDRGHGLRLSSDDLLDCGWPVSAEWLVPEEADSGLYAGLLRLTGQEVEEAQPVTFAVSRRHPRRPDSVALLLATNTWYAYGRRPADVAPAFGLSASFYSSHASGRPHFWLTTQAPIPRASPFGFESARAERVGHSHLVRPERYAEAWLTREGYAYEVITDADLHAEPSLLGGFNTLLIAGHSEYWSDDARDGVDSFLDRGGNVLSLSGDSLHWRVSFDPTGELLECRKDVAEPDRRWLDPAWWGERWHTHDARAGGSFRLLGRPAHETIGLDAQGMIDDGTPTAFRPLRVLEPGHPLFQRPEAVPISAGGTIGELCLNGPKVSGYEFDAVPEVVGTRSAPLPGSTLLAVADQPNLEWQGRYHDRGAHLIDWVRPAGGHVISLGSIGATGSLGVDPGVSALVRNALALFGAARRT